MAEETITINFQLNEKDYKKFSTHVFLRYRNRLSFFEIFLMFVVYILLGVFVAYIFQSTINQNVLTFLSYDVLRILILTVLLFSPGVGTCLAFDFFYKQNSARVLKNDKMPLAQTIISFSPDNISLSSQYVKAEYPWEGFEKIEIQNGDLCLFTSTLTAIYIPKRFFKTEQEMEFLYEKLIVWFERAKLKANSHDK